MPGSRTLPRTDRPRGRRRLWSFVIAVTIVAFGASGVILVSRAERGATPTLRPSGPSPIVTAQPTPVPPPGESLLDSVAIPGSGACPGFGRHRPDVPGPDLEGYLNSILDCLMTVNDPGFKQAGVALRRPGLAPDSAVSGSGCIGGIDQPENWVGLYCPRSATIYYRADWDPGDPVEYLDVLTHEFAHHLQQEAGLLNQVSRDQAKARRELNAEVRAQELSRRVELQAECITGVMVGPDGAMALRSRDLRHLVELRSSVPPDWAASHGTGRAQTHWFERGTRAGGPQRYAACNTFAAPADVVE